MNTKEESKLLQSPDEHAESEEWTFGTSRRDIHQQRAVLETVSETLIKNENESRSTDIRQKCAEMDPGTETS